MLISMVDSL